MAIPFQPQNLTAEQADGNILLTWTGSLGATGYLVTRSTDGVNYASVATLGLVSSYVDSYPGVGTQYFYKVAATNSDGASPYSNPAGMVAAPPGEMSLYELRLRSQQTADRVNSNFVTTSEWNAFLRLALYELYDLQIGVYEDYGVLDPVLINTTGSIANYVLPNGINYRGGVFGGSSGTPAAALYKILGVDLAVNTSNNAWVTINKYNFIDRNNYVYPNSTSTIYGVFNMRYRQVGKNLNMIPTPAGNQQLRLWYAPILPALLADTDVTTIGYNGYLRYAIVRAAKYALDKEQDMDTSKLAEELLFLKTRIEQMASNRDEGQPDTISATRKDQTYGGTGWGSGGQNGGW